MAIQNARLLSRLTCQPATRPTVRAKQGPEGRLIPFVHVWGVAPPQCINFYTKKFWCLYTFNILKDLATIMFKRYVKLRRISFAIKNNKFWNIKNICSECIFILFAQVRNPVLRRFANFLKVNQYLFWVWFELAWFVPISRFHVKTMGVGTNCPDIKDKWVISSWVEYGNRTHTWLTIGQLSATLSLLEKTGFKLAAHNASFNNSMLTLIPY